MAIAIDHHVAVELNMVGPQGPTDGRRAIVVFLPEDEPAEEAPPAATDP